MAFYAITIQTPDGRTVTVADGESDDVETVAEVVAEQFVAVSEEPPAIVYSEDAETWSETSERVRRNVIESLP